MKRKIFIASATETRDTLATRIAQLISDAGFEPVRWWIAFRPGDLAVDRLRELAASVDGAVFICLGTDKSWYRGQESDVPRDNVIFEFGLFLQSLGKERAIVVADKAVKLPSDLQGLTYLTDRGDAETTGERVVSHFKQQFQARSREPAVGLLAIPIEVDRVVAEASLRSPVPRGWHQRSLYVGTEGARAWMAVSQEPGTLRPADEDKVRQLILQSVRNLSIRSFVSLGPGTGEIDREIVISLKDPAITYLPVDISEGLLFHSCNTLADHAHVPLGVLSDFEERIPFIKYRLSKWLRRPALFALLGNTFGNLDRFEATLLSQLENWLEPGDRILFQVSTAPSDWTVEQAPIRSSQHSVSRRRFFAQGLARQLNISAEDILRDYESRITHRVGRSDVPEALSVDFSDMTTGIKLQSFRWYRWPKLLEWIEATFRFKIANEFFLNYEGEIRGEGIALLERF